MNALPEDLLKPLRGMYLAQLRERAASTEAFLEHCRSGSIPENERALMCQLAHKLSGSGTTYGYPLITQGARALEQALLAEPPASAAALMPLAESLVHACGQALLQVERGAVYAGVVSGASEQSPDTGKTVLIADDDIMIRDLLALKFSLVGVRALTAGDGQEALRLAHECKPQLAILDRMMPGLNGLQVLLAFRESPELRETPVIFLTALRQEKEILEAFRNGAADYVVKPFLPEEVLARGLRLLGVDLAGRL